MEPGAAELDAGAFGLSVVGERTPGGEPVLDADEGEELAQTFPQVACVLGNSLDQGQGSLYITTRRVIWLSSTQPQQGFAADFHSINIHAISQDPQAYQKACIYMQLEGPSGDDDADEEADSAPEIRFVPADSSSLEPIFKVLCDCATLNPDPGLDGDEEDGDFFYDEDEVTGASEPHSETLDRLDGLLSMPRADDLDELVAEDPERFDDPEDDADVTAEADADMITRPHANGSADHKPS